MPPTTYVAVRGKGGPKRKAELEWMSCIRLPEFVTPDVFDWAVQEATRKKKANFLKAEMVTVDEGLCVQCMHVGSYDDEPATIDALRGYVESEGMRFDQSKKRLHHEVYLSDPRRVAPERLKTVIRIPVKPAQGGRASNGQGLGEARTRQAPGARTREACRALHQARRTRHRSAPPSTPPGSR